MLGGAHQATRCWGGRRPRRHSRLRQPPRFGGRCTCISIPHVPWPWCWGAIGAPRTPHRPHRRSSRQQRETPNPYCDEGKSFPFGDAARACRRRAPAAALAPAAAGRPGCGVGGGSNLQCAMPAAAHPCRAQCNAGGPGRHSGRGVVPVRCLRHTGGTAAGGRVRARQRHRAHGAGCGHRRGLAAVGGDRHGDCPAAVGVGAGVTRWGSVFPWTFAQRMGLLGCPPVGPRFARAAVATRARVCNFSGGGREGGPEGGSRWQGWRAAMYAKWMARYFAVTHCWPLMAAGAGARVRVCVCLPPGSHWHPSHATRSRISLSGGRGHAQQRPGQLRRVLHFGVAGQRHTVSGTPARV